MNFENSTLTTNQKEKALNEKWYSRFEEIGAFKDFKLSVGNKEKREK